jgi:3-hydroxyisobutyrate dehydrogenase-like beta-hydroxyacid dehydrogenase
MAPIHPKRLATPIRLGGAHAAAFLETARSLGFNAIVQSESIGAASAVKMCRSVMIKGLEALTLECLPSARRAGVEGEVLASLSESFPGLDWRATAAYNLERMATHGVRRSEEMCEVAKTVQELGLEPHMASATAEHPWAVGHLGLMERCGGSYPKDLRDFVDAISRSVSATVDEQDA